MRKILFPLILFVLMLGWSCGSGPADLTLTGVTWKFIKIGTGRTSEQAINSPGDYTLKLNDKGKFKMKSGCNKCSGDYKVSSKFIKFINLDCTKKMCGKGSFDYLFRTNVEKASSFEISEGQLKLKSFKSTLFFLPD